VSPADRVRSEFLAQSPKRALLEFYMYRYNPAHRWCYFKDLDVNELLVFKGFEGDAEHCANVIHGAFDHPECPAGTAPRRSIETRAFAFFLH
jgi:hypothetical protein